MGKSGNGSTVGGISCGQDVKAALKASLSCPDRVRGLVDVESAVGGKRRGGVSDQAWTLESVTRMTARIFMILQDLLHLVVAGE